MSKEDTKEEAPNSAQIRLPFSSKPDGDEDINREPSSEWAKPGFEDFPDPPSTTTDMPPEPPRATISATMLREARAAQWRHPREAWDNEFDEED